MVLRRCLPHNSEQVAILAAVRVHSGYPRIGVLNVSRTYADLEGSLRSNTNTECNLAIGVITIELLRARAIVLVGQIFRARLRGPQTPEFGKRHTYSVPGTAPSRSDPVLAER